MDETESEDFAEPDLSLQELSDAYARLLETDDRPRDKAADGNESEFPEHDETTDADELDSDDIPLDETDANSTEVSPVGIVEAMLFVGHPENKRLTNREVASLIRGVSPNEIDEVVAELNQRYVQEGRPYIIDAAPDGFRMELRSEFHSVRDQFYGRVKDVRLSRQIVEVLSLVAYNQPCTREEIDKLRGKPSGGLLNQLVRRDLLSIERNEENSRIVHYRTTDRFLDLFGLDSVKDLPHSPEM